MTALEDILASMSDVGLRMSALDAAEGAAGNLSVFDAGEFELTADWMPATPFTLPVAVPNLAGGWMVVTGTGRRLRDIAHSPERAVCLLHIGADGRHAELHTARDVRPTSELNTHLSVHNDHVGRRGLRRHGLVHAQPLRLTYLSHIARYGETRAFNRRLLRWQPETIVEFPEGIGVLPFQVPGSAEQMTVTTEGLARYRAIIWARHGIVTRSDHGIGKASDLVEYAEAAARYEYLNLVAGEPTEGLPDAELRTICERLGIEQSYF